MREKKLRIEDALAATRAAVEEGIVAGGGATYIDALGALDSLTLTGDEKTGLEIIRRALEEPLRQIVNNAGHEGSVVVAKVHSEKRGVGFNVVKEIYEDMIGAGIVDPAKVARTALQNASSIASMLLTTECIISDIPAPENPMAGMGAGGMGGMGGMM